MNVMAAVGAILNSPTPTREEKTAARLRTLGLILPITTTMLVRTDLPPALILIDYPNGLLGSEPRREREHAWWETGPGLRDLLRCDAGFLDPERLRWLLNPPARFPWLGLYGAWPPPRTFVSITGVC